jgi:hypothetical protein
MPDKSIAPIAAMGIDTGKHSFRVIGLDRRGAITLRQMRSRGQIEARLAGRAAVGVECEVKGGWLYHPRGCRGPLQAMASCLISNTRSHRRRGRPWVEDASANRMRRHA